MNHCVLFWTGMYFSDTIVSTKVSSFSWIWAIAAKGSLLLVAESLSTQTYMHDTHDVPILVHRFLIWNPFALNSNDILDVSFTKQMKGLLYVRISCWTLLYKSSKLLYLSLFLSWLYPVPLESLSVLGLAARVHRRHQAAFHRPSD